MQRIRLFEDSRIRLEDSRIRGFGSEDSGIRGFAEDSRVRLRIRGFAKDSGIRKLLQVLLRIRIRCSVTF